MRFVVKRLLLSEQDALEAAVWYDEREPGLGDGFLDEVDAAVQVLARDALIHRVRFADVRRVPCAISSFMASTTSSANKEVWVIAVHHGRRHPRWLQQRREQVG